MSERKRFFTYEEQVELLKSKKLSVPNEKGAIDCLKQFGYYSLVSGYKDIFKIEKNGNYRGDACFEHLVRLYLLDDYLRNIFLHKIIAIEKNIKSLYSYYFCETYGDRQNDYLNVNNYNYGQYQEEVNDFVAIIKKNIKHADKYHYVQYNISKYGEVPLWVIIQTLTFGNISKMFMFAEESLQSKIARNFDGIFGKELSSMLGAITKFRNVCAHGERFYNFKIQTGIMDLPIHKDIEGQYNISKNDLFHICLCFRYLLYDHDYGSFMRLLSEILETSFETYNDYYKHEILSQMGFPENWEEILTK